MQGEKWVDPGPVTVLDESQAETRAALIAAIRRGVDWSYWTSDNHDVFSRGRDAIDDVVRMAKRLPQKEIDAVWEQLVPKTRAYGPERFWVLPPTSTATSSKHSGVTGQPGVSCG